MTQILLSMSLVHAFNNCLLDKTKQALMRVCNYVIFPAAPVDSDYNVAWLGAGPVTWPCSNPIRRSNHAIDELINEMILNSNTRFLRLGNNNKHFPVFCTLPRPRCLTSKCPIISSNREDQELVEKIWNNQNIAYVFQDESHLDNRERFCCMIFCDQPIATIAGCSETKTFFEIPNGSILSQLQAEDCDVLLFRIIHSFLRCWAFVLPTEALLSIKRAVESIESIARKSLMEDYLDWQILWADLCLNLLPGHLYGADMSSEIRDSMVHVGTSLEALGRFDEAASIYLELGNALCEILLDDDSFGECAPQSFYMAGEAFLVAGKDNNALDCFVKHLQVAVQNDPDPDPNMYQEDLLGMIRAYCSRFAGQSSAIGCLGLMGVANPRLAQDWKLLLKSCDVTSLLKKRFQCPAYSKKVLVRLMQSGSVVEYMKVFGSCLASKESLPIPGGNHGFFQGIRESLLGHYKDASKV